MAYQTLNDQADKLRQQVEKLEKRATQARSKAMFPVGTKVRIVGAKWERFNEHYVGVVVQVFRDPGFEYVIEYPGRDDCFDCSRCPGHKRTARISDRYVKKAPQSYQTGRSRASRKKGV